MDAPGKTEPRAKAASVRTPCQIPTGRAANATPHPREAAKAIDANPSRMDLSTSWSIPMPIPSLKAPRIASGPIAKMSDASTKP
ncbi:unannotated protein [freshwater metagenome]|uniref:Unannotated protein n=1 Tax=freshwater metagenome TaxID=449393 RepID=A0A6J6IPU0_9ZZZZ